MTLDGRTHVPGQGNNVYVFPGIGLGALVAEASQVSDTMFLKAAQKLASLASDEDLAVGRVYPALSKVREVSIHIATAVAEEAYARGLARRPRPDDIEADIRARVFDPDYYDYV